MPPGLPTAPTIADLLGRNPVAPVTSNEDAARRSFAEQMGSVGRAGSLPGGISAAGQHIANAILGKANLERAREADVEATAAEGERRSRIAEMLGGVGGLSPEQAVGMAGGSPQDNALFLSIMGAKQQQEAAEQARAERAQATTVDAARRQEDVAHRNRTFDAGRADAATSNALKQSALDLTMQDRALAKGQALAQQGHLEALIADKSPEEQALALADPAGYIASLQNQQNDEFTVEVNRILQANPGLAESEEGIRQAQNVALGNIKSATDPVHGGTGTFNLATGVGAPIETPTELVDPIGQSTSGPLSIDEISSETGLGPLLADYWSRTAGQFNPDVVDKAKAKALTQQRFIKTKLRSALMNNARGAIWEQKQIDQLLPDEGVFESPGRAAQIFRSAKEQVAMEHNFNAEQINSGKLTSDVEKKLREKNVELESVYNLLPDPGQFADVAPAEPAADDSQQQIRAGRLDAPWQDVLDTAAKYGLTPAQVLDQLEGAGG